MILQLGAFFGGAVSQLGSLFRSALPQIGAAGLDIGKQFVGGLIQKELNRSSRNDLEDAIKAQLRAAANAITPTVAPGQGPVFSGGPPVGAPFITPTLLPPSIQPPARVLQIDPGLSIPSSFASFQTQRRGGRAPVQAGMGTAAVEALKRFGRFIDPRNPFGRQGALVAGGAVALETAGAVATDFLFPPIAEAPGRNGFTAVQDFGAPLRIGIPMPNGVATPTGLPAIGRFQKEANGCFVQWYFFDGNQHVPISRADARDCIKKECIYRLDVFRGKFVKLKPRRINPMNVRAFFRAGRRVDAGERICRKMFSEKRKQKTGTVRRKSSHRKK